MKKVIAIIFNEIIINMKCFDNSTYGKLINEKNYNPPLLIGGWSLIK